MRIQAVFQSFAAHERSGNHRGMKMESVTFNCPHCQQSLEAPGELLGRAIECPACNQNIQTPAPKAQAAPQPLLPLPPQEKKPPLSFKAMTPPAQAAPPPANAGFFGPERKGVQKGVLGGVTMMVIAVVWFIGGYMAGYIFFYPPILFFIGLYAFIKGLVTGNVTGRE